MFFFFLSGITGGSACACFACSGCGHNSALLQINDLCRWKIACVLCAVRQVVKRCLVSASTHDMSSDLALLFLCAIGSHVVRCVCFFSPGCGFLAIFSCSISREF